MTWGELAGIEVVMGRFSCGPVGPINGKSAILERVKPLAIVSAPRLEMGVHRGLLGATCSVLYKS